MSLRLCHSRQVLSRIYFVLIFSDGYPLQTTGMTDLREEWGCQFEVRDVVKLFSVRTGLGRRGVW